MLNNEIAVLGWGSAVGSVDVPNEALTQFPASVRPAIAQKTGIFGRRHSSEDEATSDLAITAARRALVVGRIDPADLGAIIVATSTPDHLLPATAAIVQHTIGAGNAASFDLNAVCSGGVYGLIVGHALAAAQGRPVLVIGADTYSKILNPKDFGTYPYFGDGAGAVIMGLRPVGRPALIFDPGSFIWGTDGSGSQVIVVPAGGSREPASRTGDPSRLFFKMAGRQVYDFAVSKGEAVVRELIKRCGDQEPIGNVVLHQANINILREISQRVGVPMDRFPVNLDRLGNTAAAGVLIALTEVLDQGAFPVSTSVLLVAFGGGLSWAGLRLVQR